MIAHLMDINKSEFNLNDFKRSLVENCVNLLQTERNEILNKFAFSIEKFDDVDKELLVFGFIRGEYVPEQRYSSGKNMSISTRSAFYRYPLTEKLYQYRYWLELNGNYNEDFQITYLKEEK